MAERVIVNLFNADGIVIRQDIFLVPRAELVYNDDNNKSKIIVSLVQGAIINLYESE